MEYKGKLYGRLQGKLYFDTGKTADDWDAIEKRATELEAENQSLRQNIVIGSLPASAVAIRFKDWCDRNKSKVTLEIPSNKTTGQLWYIFEKEAL